MERMGDADKILDYEEVVHVFIRRSHPRSQAVHHARQADRSDDSAAWLPNQNSLKCSPVAGAGGAPDQGGAGPVDTPRTTARTSRYPDIDLSARATAIHASGGILVVSL